MFVSRLSFLWKPTSLFCGLTNHTGQFRAYIPKFHRCLTEQAHSRVPYHDGPREHRKTSDPNFRLLQNFPYAKDILLYLNTLLQQQTGRNALGLSMDARQLTRGGTTTWEAVVSVKWPVELIFYGKSASKTEAVRIACAQVCSNFRALGVLDKNNKPVIYTSDQVNVLRAKRYAPVKLSLKPTIVAEVEAWNRRFYDWTGPLAENQLTFDVSPVVAEYEELFDDIDQAEYRDVVSGEVKVLPPRQELEDISDNLHAAYIWRKNSQDAKVRVIQDKRNELPIYGRREEILETIRDNPVTLISGDTGSGKSTQVPQFIFEDLIATNRGSEAQVVITQPRRISAVSIAERVAFERNEELGQTVGFQVRLESVIPAEYGCLFFCTTGILLRRLQDNPTLRGVSHVIVDEVHERDVLIDVLLSLLKRALKENPDLRIVLMSASLNVDLLKTFFDNCPVVHVAGYIHPVREYFLPEVCKMVGQPLPDVAENDPRTSSDLLFNLIKHIDSTRPEGGILVFLPGWQEIKMMRNRIRETFYKPDRHLIFPLHSLIPLKEQHKVFDRLPSHQRKIVLATDIAETAITIDDISYVIDAGNHRGQTYDAERGITTLDIFWISKANAIQRRGRAGRVRAGECYRLYTKERFDSFQPFGTPEILRTSLEKVILDGKVFCPPATKAAEFLSQLPQPPESEGIEKALEELIELRVLNTDETLTPMGERVAHFTTHPRVSIALVYAVFLRCLNPVLSIAGFLSTNRDPFVNRLENKAYIRQVKEMFSSGTRSDHISMANLLQSWSEIQDDEEEVERFCEKLGISNDQLKFIEGIRQVLCDHLYDAFLMDKTPDVTSQLLPSNEYAKSSAFIKASLTAGAGNNILRVSEGVPKKGRIHQELVVTLPETDVIVEMSRESLLSEMKQASAEPWLIYHSKFKSGESRKTIVREVSEIPSLIMALFGGQGLEIDEKDDDEERAVLTFCGNPKAKFDMDSRSARAVFELRKNIEDLVNLSLKCRDTRPEEVDNMWDTLRDLLYKLLTV